jgi:hypothetical protein
MRHAIQPQSFGGADASANYVDHSVPWDFQCHYLFSDGNVDLDREMPGSCNPAGAFAISVYRNGECQSGNPADCKIVCP